MVKRILAIILAAIAVLMCTSCASINEISQKIINPRDAETFLKDSQDAIAYLFAYEPENADKTELDSDLKVRMAAAAIAARADYFDGMGSTFLIPAEDIEAEVADLFADADISDFEGNNFVSKDENGDYHLLNGDWGDMQPKFEIVDMTYGIIGSVPPTITVRYTFENFLDEEDVSDGDEYEAVYTYEPDICSGYTFKIKDFRGKYLTPADEISDVAE